MRGLFSLKDLGVVPAEGVGIDLPEVFLSLSSSNICKQKRVGLF